MCSLGAYYNTEINDYQMQTVLYANKIVINISHISGISKVGDIYTHFREKCKASGVGEPQNIQLISSLPSNFPLFLNL